MNDADAVELLELVRDRWKADPQTFTETEHVAWRAELVLITYPAARDTLRAMHVTSPHRRPTLAAFIDEVHARANRLSPEQIARNIAGLDHVRSQLTRNRQDQSA